jgi:hypothetical protein
MDAEWAKRRQRRDAQHDSATPAMLGDAQVRLQL